MTMEREERNHRYRETLSKVFIDMAKIVFTGVVIGGVSPAVIGSETAVNFVIVISGALISFVAAWIGCRILKP